jgi:hypothetical protein
MPSKAFQAVDQDWARDRLQQEIVRTRIRGADGVPGLVVIDKDHDPSVGPHAQLAVRQPVFMSGIS